MTTTETTETAMSVTTIDLVPADSSSRYYGILLSSETRHQMTGRGVHNRHFNHRIDVWENRPSKATGADPDVIVDPHGKPTTDRYTYLCKAEASVISAHPMERAPEGPALAIGQVIDLAVSGYVIGRFTVTAGMLSDPILVPVA